MKIEELGRISELVEERTNLREALGNRGKIHKLDVYVSRSGSNDYQGSRLARSAIRSLQSIIVPLIWSNMEERLRAVESELVSLGVTLEEEKS